MMRRGAAGAGGLDEVAGSRDNLGTLDSRQVCLEPRTNISTPALVTWNRIGTITKQLFA